MNVTQIPVNTAPAYTVTVGKNLLDSCGGWLSPLCPLGKAALVSDDRVAALYAHRVTASLTAGGYTVYPFVFPAGEEQKTPATFFSLVRFLSENGFSRTDTVVALGGGVTGDLAGFAAGVYLRGLPFVQVPTTLLSAVDASVGGKTGVNLPDGKNRMGVFHQPRGVLCDTATFDTLPDRERQNGMAEVIKTAVIGDGDLFAALERGGVSDGELVSRCVTLKAALVAADPKDNGVRRLLNLGHTVGHAMERVSGFTLPHGFGVSAGMAILARAGERRGLCQPGTAARLTALLLQYGLPVSTEFSAEELTAAALFDKKRAGERLTLVIPEQIGHSVLLDIPVSELGAFLREGIAE